MSIIMLVLAAIPAVIALFNAWKNKKASSLADVKTATDKLAAINFRLKTTPSLRAGEKRALAQLRRRTGQIMAAKRETQALTDSADGEGLAALFAEIGNLNTYCHGAQITEADHDDDLHDLK